LVQRGGHFIPAFRGLLLPALTLISGIGLISLLKEQSPGTPIIAMTGWGKEPGELATEVKADTILMKPFDLEELDQSMDKLLVYRIQ